MRMCQIAKDKIAKVSSKFCQILYQNGQSFLKVMLNWQNFAKSGHTESPCFFFFCFSLTIHTFLSLSHFLTLTHQHSLSLSLSLSVRHTHSLSLFLLSLNNRLHLAKAFRARPQARMIVLARTWSLIQSRSKKFKHIWKHWKHWKHSKYFIRCS